MKHPKYMLITLVLLLSFWTVSSEATESLTEEAKNDPTYLAQYNCLPGHFQLETYLKANEYERLIERVDELGFQAELDRDMLEAKALAQYFVGLVGDAVVTQEMALKTKSICQLLRPKDFPNKFYDALDVNLLAQLYYAAGQIDKYEQFQKQAEALLRKALESENMSESTFQRLRENAWLMNSLNRRAYWKGTVP